MTQFQRERLPNRRRSEALTIVLGGVVYDVQLGFYPDGRLGEVFIYAGKVGSAVDVACRDAAIAISLALQHGADLENLRKAFTRNADGRADGILGALLDRLHYREVALH